MSIIKKISIKVKEKINSSYKVKLTAVLLMYLLIPFLLLFSCLAVFWVSKMYVQVEEKLKESSLIYQNRLVGEQESMLEMMTFLTRYSRLNELLTVKEKISLMQMIDWKAELNEVLDGMTSMSKQMQLTVYSTNGNIYDVEYVKKMDETHAKAYEGMEVGEIRWSVFREQGKLYLNGIKCYSPGVGQRAVIDMKVTADDIFALSALEENESFTVYVCNGTVVPIYLENENQLKMAEKYIEEGRLGFLEVISYRPSGIGGTFYTLIDTHRNQQFLLGMFVAIMAFFTFVCICIIFVVKATAGKMTKRLIQIVEEVTCDEIKAPGIAGNDGQEFDIIQNKLYELVCDLREQNDKILKLELDNLSSKISPHFLYNNLSAIKLKSKDLMVNQVVDCLVAYYRYQFRNNQSFCLLQKEVDNLENYVQLLRFSYEEEFVFWHRVPQELEELPIPSNSLQPLVENAFLYGINNKSGDKIIQMDVHMEDGNVLIEVSDNGNGNFVKKTDRESSVTIIDRRLKLYYGDQFGLAYFKKNGFTIAQIRIPIREEH